MDENKLIFLISQPRSGSSMLQQLILNSTEINSTPEPWQMLSLINTYRNTDISLGHNQSFTIINFKEHLSLQDNGFNKFKMKIKDLSLSLYSENLNGKSHYLDKTPRYYHIIDELYELFPNAKFIFLVRNPLSVFASILDYNFKGNLKAFLKAQDRQDDLFLAPLKISSAIKKYQNNIFVKYEDLIENPNNSMKDIYEYLGVKIPEKYDSYNVSKQFELSNALDNKSLKKHDRPIKIFIDAWKTTIDTTGKKKVALEFLKKINSRDVPYFDYNLDKTIYMLTEHKPNFKTNFNLGLGYYLCKEEELTLKQIIKKRVYQKFQKND